MEDNNCIPWKSYQKVFHVEEKDIVGLNFSAKCLLCLPLKRMIKASKSSSSNLRKHVQKVHPSQLSTLKGKPAATHRDMDKEEEEEVDGDIEPQTPKKKICQRTMEDYRNGGFCSQTNFNSLLTKWVIQSYQSFSTVENQDFINMIKGAGEGPAKTVMSRKALMASIEEAVGRQKAELQDIFSSIAHVATTADSWKTFNRSYLGVTAHWLDGKTFERKTTVLACRRVVGSQTFDILARMLTEINTEFALQNKVVSTTTDNGSNFVKAFRVYGTEEEAADEEDAEETEFLDLGEILENNDESSIILPRHERCAAHTLNLVASKDVEAASKEDTTFKRKSVGALGRCNGLWNKQSRSSLHADIIKGLCKRYLVVPNSTRWNSMYDSMLSLQRAIKEDMESLNQAIDKLGLPRFKQDDITYIDEYCKVMEPLSSALDFLQGEKTAYMAILLPTLHCLRRRLLAIHDSGELEICQPLVKAVIGGLDKRFESQWYRRDLVLAAVLHPSFHFSWIKDEAKEQLARQWLQAAVRRESPSQDFPKSVESKKGFFDFERPSTSAVLSADTEFNKFLAFPSEDLSILNSFPIIKTLFLQYNTPIPSSAGVERVFSVGGLVFSERRGKMSDKNFENVVMLKVGYTK